MTIQTTFQYGAERVVVRIIGENVLFVDLQTNIMAPIEGLKFSKEGVETEFPDLKGDKDWKQKAIQRFVDKVKNLKTEKERMKWVIEELKNMGYIPLFMQRQGFRPQKIR